METLKTVDQHRSVCLFEDVWPDLDHVIRCYSNEVSIERRVVESAERDAIWDRRNAKRIGVSDDVGRFEELIPTQTTDGAVMLIGVNDSFPELTLV